MGRKSISKIRREEIIKAFYDVIAEKGLSKASTRQIAEAADCSLGMLHHYFSNKEEIVLAAVDYASNLYADLLRQDISEFGSEFGSVSEKLGYIITWYTNIDEFDLKWFRSLNEFRALALTNPKVADSLTSFFLGTIKLLTKVIKEGIETGELREQDPIVTANLILGSLEGVVALWLVDPKSTNLPKIGKDLEQMVLRYLWRDNKKKGEK